jgi:hypothetical protein
MKMRPGHAARSATQSQGLPFAYFLAFPHLDFRKMHIDGEEVLSSQPGGGKPVPLRVSSTGEPLV